MLSCSHSGDTTLIPHCFANSYFFPFGDAATRCVIVLVRSPLYVAPCSLTRVASFLLSSINSLVSLALGRLKKIFFFFFETGGFPSIPSLRFVPHILKPARAGNLCC